MTRQRSGLGAAPSTGGGGGGTTDASALTTGVVAKARGGFGADMSAASGIVKWTAGVISFLTAPASAVLGLTDTQSPTNKTLDNSNSIDAAAIKSGTIAKARGGFAADVSGATGLPKFAAGVLSFLTAPAGAILGDTDTQSPTNKTIDVVSNTISDSGGADGDLLLRQSARYSRLSKGASGEILTVGPATGNVVWCPSPGTIQPEDAGLLEWNYDIELAIAALQGAPTAGVLYLRRVRFREARLVTGLSMVVATAGATLTAGNCFGAIYQGGLLLGQTVDQQVAWQTTGRKDMALSSTASVAKGDAWIGWWGQGTTLPRMAGTNGGGAPNSNGRVAVAANGRAASTATGLTTTAPGTLGALTLGPATAASFYAGAY